APQSIHFTYLGAPRAGAPIVRHICDDSGTLPAGLIGSVATAGTAAAATAVFDIALNGTNIATMTFPATATAGFASSTAVAIAQGDVLTVTPRSTDAQLADIAGFL